MLDLMHVNDISEGIRNLCLGRVLLKSDYVPGSGELVVGYTDVTDFGLSIPGTCLFRKSYATAKVVQPTAADIPGAAGVEHTETVTITGGQDAGLVGDPINLPIDEDLVNEYTVARKAYVELSTLPTVCSGMNMIDEDFLELGIESPDDHWFPGLFVIWEMTSLNPWTNISYRSADPFIVRYLMVEERGRNNRQVLVERVQELVNLIEEDNYLGATVEESNVVAIVPCWNSERKMRQVDRVFATASGKNFIWADIVLETYRTAVWDKRSVS